MLPRITGRAAEKLKDFGVVGFVGKTHISFVASVNFVGNRSAEEGTKKISVRRVL